LKLLEIKIMSKFLFHMANKFLRIKLNMQVCFIPTWIKRYLNY
jgi:hypothetical protein